MLSVSLWLAGIMMCILSTCVFAANPIGKIEVSLRGHVYEIKDVTTVTELRERLRDLAGDDDEVLEGSLEYKGIKLQGTDILSEVGFREGSKLTFVPGGRHQSNSFMFGNAGRDNQTKRPSLEEIVEGKHDLDTILASIQSLKSQELAASIREFMEWFYSELRKLSDDPSARAQLAPLFESTEHIEGLRQTFLKDKEQIQGLPAFVSVMEDKERFHSSARKVLDTAVATWGTVLDALQEVVVDNLRGAAIRKAEEDALAESGHPYSINDDSSPITNFLFELSESDED